VRGGGGATGRSALVPVGAHSTTPKPHAKQHKAELFTPCPPRDFNLTVTLADALGNTVYRESGPSFAPYMFAQSFGFSQ
jgi:hypothetical protein